MRIVWANPAKKDLKRLPRDGQIDVVGAVETFASTGVGDIRRHLARPPELALRVREWRVFLMVAEDLVTVLGVRPRGGAYRP